MSAVAEHAMKRTLVEVAWWPTHDPRKASAEYGRTHHKLVVEMDEPCWICGIRNSDVQKLPKAERHLRQIETHHSMLEWAAEAAFESDPIMLAKLIADLNGQHPQELLRTVVGQIGDIVHGDDPAALRQFLDSEGNMLILCAFHHRGAGAGIHTISFPAWSLQRYQHQGGFEFIRVPVPAA